jgi:hypothetical protein
MMSNMVDLLPTIYLDRNVMVAGSGFIPGESVNVLIQTTEGAGPSLGFADAGPGGAWVLLTGTLNEKSLIRISEAALVSAPALTLMGDGSFGSKASTPVRAAAKAPVAPPPPPPSNATIAAGIDGRVEPGANAMVYGVGYMPGENVNIIAVDAKDTGMLLTSAVAGASGAFSKDVSIDLAPGFYTVEGFGSTGSFAAGPLIVVDK